MTQDANALELAAQEIEAATRALSVNGIATIIETTPDPTNAAFEIHAGITQYFGMMAESLRKRSTEDAELTLSERDKQMIDLTLDQVHDAIFSLIKNPAKNPRKNFSPLKKRGVWWEDIVAIIEGLRQHPRGLDAAATDAKTEGFREGIAAAAAKLRTLTPFIRTEAGPKARKPEEYAEEVEKLAK